MRKRTVEVLIVDSVVLILTHFVHADEQWRIYCASGQEAGCLVRSDPSYFYSLLTRYFSMRNGTMLLMSPPTLDWIQVFVVVLVMVNVWFVLRTFVDRQKSSQSIT